MADRRSSNQYVEPVGVMPPSGRWVDVPDWITSEERDRLLSALGAQLSLDDPDLDYITEALETMRLAWVDMTDPDALRLAIAAGRYRAKLVMEHIAAGTTAPQHPTTDIWQGRRSRSNRERPVVYYMRLGNRCKIGFTLDVRKRQKQIQPEEVLAIEDGSLGLEAERHEQFKALRVSGEWFRYESELVEHVEKLRAAAA